MDGGQLGLGDAAVARKPRISLVSPAEGAPGWKVTVHGSGFTNVRSVRFGGVALRVSASSRSCDQ